MSKGRFKQAGGIVAGLGLGAFGGFLAGLLRKRPPTGYTRSLRQPVPSEDEQTGGAATAAAEPTQPRR